MSISIVLSGGSDNKNPNLSLGGEPSSNAISPFVNNLFGDVPQVPTVSTTEYRCIYIFNDNAYSISSAHVLAENSENCLLGVRTATDLQRVEVTGTVVTGNFILDYDGTQFTVPHNPNVVQWATNFQDQISAISGLEDVEVGVFNNSTTVFFTVGFLGDSDNKYHPLLTLINNNLVGSNTISISKLADGSPINAITASITSPKITPGGVSFEEDAIVIGTLLPTDGFPLWIKRTMTPNSTPKENDGFTLKFRGIPA